MDALMFLIHTTEKGTQKAMENGKSIDNNQEQYFKYIIIYYCIFILYSPMHIKNIPEVFRDILSKSEIQYVKLCVKLINERLFNHTDAYTIPARIIVD